MYGGNLVRIDYYRNRSMQQYESYDDDFKGFKKEAQASEDEFLKEDRKRKSLLSFLFRNADSVKN